MIKADIRKWALKGAEQRLLEIANEASEIHAAFPELRDGGRGGNDARLPGRPRKEDAGTTEAPRKRRRRKMSKASRRKISEAQKARWAKQRRER